MAKECRGARAGFRRCNPARARGLSLLELLYTLAIAALLFKLGAGFEGLLARERRVLAVMELQRVINHARSAAVIRGQAVTLCAIDRNRKCRRLWQGRNIATFVDTDRNRRAEPSELLRLGHWPENRGRLEWRAALRRRYLEFRPGGDSAQNGSFLLCSQGGGPAEVVVVVNRGGRGYVDRARGRRCSGRE